MAIPTSAFFSAASRAKGLGNGLVRFCFCKTDETIDLAAEALAKMAREQQEAGLGNGVSELGDGGKKGGVAYSELVVNDAMNSVVESS